MQILAAAQMEAEHVAQAEAEALASQEAAKKMEEEHVANAEAEQLAHQEGTSWFQSKCDLLPN